MALDKDRLKANLKAAYIDADQNGGDTREQQLDYFLDRLCDVLITEIKQLHIDYLGGLVAGSTPVGGTINHTVE
jgi:hypothetical protein